MDKTNILAIDHGTQSVRALIFDPSGELLAFKQIFIEPYHSSRPGYAEQNPAVFWNALCDASNGVFEVAPQLKETVKGVVLTTQRSTLLNLDKNGEPLRDAIVWLDQRRTKDLKPLGGFWGTAFKALQLTDTVAYLQAEAEANWIMKHQPEIWEQTHKFVYLSGFLTHRLTGHFKDSTGNQVGYLPFDYRRFDWCRPFDWKWQAVPIDPALLVDLVPPTEVLGEITPLASEATGIPAGLPLIAAAADKSCEVLGCGCISPEIGCLSYGTTATINTIHKKYIEVIPLIPPYPAPIPDAYSLELQVNRGYWMVNWFKEEFGLKEVLKADEIDVEPETLFEELVEAVPPGSHGLVLQPYWSPGLKTPGPEARGAIIGFGDVHSRAHMYRAIIEGLAYALREGAERTERRTGTKIRELRVAGGGSQSSAGLQITADIFGLKTVTPALSEASGLGAAVVASVGLGIHKDFDTAIAAMVRDGETYYPDPEVHETYNHIYNNIYKKMYGKLKPLYEALQELETIDIPKPE